MTTQSPEDKPTIDKEALREKYLAERDKRLRPDGNDQYKRLAGTSLAHYLADPYLPVQEREPLTDHVTVAFIGGGFAGLVTGARLKEAGIEDVRILEKGGDFGGTWYWNRYPGAQCDTASFVYMPLLEETGHVPTEKYAHAPEILEHSRRIGRHFDLYEKALFHTAVTDLVWDDERHVWVVHTDRGDAFTAQYVGMGTGPLHVPKLPGLDGIDRFEGHSFHTSRWDYDYTGGSPEGAPMAKLADKRVGIIGTGATAVQCVPHLAKACGKLFVFQRTPSSVDVRANRPTDMDWFEREVKEPGWQQKWLENFTANQAGGNASEDLVQDGWTELSRRVRSKILSLPREKMTPQNMLEAFEDTDYEKMSEIRARVDAIVEDDETAQNLKAWYRQLCKRPCFHDAYLQAYNEPSTTLVDTDGKGVERVTERGVVVAGTEYELDCIIYASGFEVGTELTSRTGFDITGRGGRKLSEDWAEGMKTLHGIHVHGYPNLFLVQPTQGANLISNVPHNLTESGRTIAMTIRHAMDHGHGEIEVTQEAQDRWIELLLSGVGGFIGASPDCTGGYYADWVMGTGPTFLTRDTTEDVILRTTFDPEIQLAAEEAMKLIFAERVRAGSEAQAAIVVMSADGARARDGRRARHQGIRGVQPRRPGQAADRLLLQALHLRRRDGSGVFSKRLGGGRALLHRRSRVGPVLPQELQPGLRGPRPLTEALARSLNIPAVKISEFVGRDVVSKVAQDFGIESDLADGPALALGVSESTLVEMTGAYAGFLNGGRAVLPYGIEELRLEGEAEALMGQGGGYGKRVVSEGAARKLVYMLSRVVEGGTGTRAQLGARPAAGKTGTTQAARDAWFVGFTADYVAGVWMGYDDNTPLSGVTGGGLPAEIWQEAMLRIHEGLEIRDLPMDIPEPPRATAEAQPERSRPPQTQAPQTQDYQVQRPAPAQEPPRPIRGLINALDSLFGN